MTLQCVPADASVFLDGFTLGSCGDQGRIPLSGGLHKIEVKKEGFWPYLTYYDPAGLAASLTVRLTRVEGD